MKTDEKWSVCRLLDLLCARKSILFPVFRESASQFKNAQWLHEGEEETGLKIRSSISFEMFWCFEDRNIFLCETHVPQDDYCTRNTPIIQD